MGTKAVRSQWWITHGDEGRKESVAEHFWGNGKPGVGGGTHTWGQKAVRSQWRITHGDTGSQEEVVEHIWELAQQGTSSM